MKPTEIDKNKPEEEEDEKDKDLEFWDDGYDIWRQVITWDTQTIDNNIINAYYPEIKEVKFTCNHLELIDLITLVFSPDRKQIERYMYNRFGVLNKQTGKIELVIPDEVYDKHRINKERNRNPEYLMKMIEANLRLKMDKLEMVLGNHVNNLAKVNRNTIDNFILNRATKINVSEGSGNNSGMPEDTRNWFEKLFMPKKKKTEKA